MRWIAEKTGDAVSDPGFREYFARALQESSVRFRVRPNLMIEEFLETIRSEFGDSFDVYREDVEMDIDEGEAQRFELPIRGAADRGLPFAVGAFDEQGVLVSISELAVLLTI